MSKLLEDIVLELSREVRAGFVRVNERFDEVKEDMNRIDGKVKQQQMTILDHSYVDIETSNRIEEVERKVAKVENLPLIYVKKTGTVVVALIGITSTLLSIVWAIRNLTSG